MTDKDKIIQIAIQNNNVFKTKMIVDAGVRKERIKQILEAGLIKKIDRGYYALANVNIDSFYAIQQRHSKGVFSYGTAAYLMEMIRKCPKTIDYTVPRGYNTSRFNMEQNIKYHYVLDNLYDIGLTETVSPEGELVRVYDRERILCDFIRHRNRIEPNLYSEVLKSYFKSPEKNMKRLARYSQIFRVTKELELYVNVL